MMLERSIQAAFLKPVVIALAFGVGIAFFVTLLLVPAMYTIGVDIGKQTSRARNAIVSRLPWNKGRQSRRDERHGTI